MHASPESVKSRRDSIKVRPSGAEPTLRDAMSVSARVLRWYSRYGRQLPWRETRDPFAILVSEVMLQQTQAARVVPYYERFLAGYPDVEALAAAPPRDVLAAWSGLGYNR